MEKEMLIQFHDKAPDNPIGHAEITIQYAADLLNKILEWEALGVVPANLIRIQVNKLKKQLQ